MGRARDIANVLSSSTNIALDSEIGLSLITPTSIATTGGSATSSISSTGTVSFTSASAISLNGVFSATYDDYKILINCVASTDTDLSFRWRTSGTDNTVSSYQNRNGEYVAVFQAYDNAQRTYANIGYCRDQTNLYRIEVANPFVAKRTNMVFHNNMENAQIIGGVLFENTTSFDGFTIIPTTGTITGTISVYGYRN